MNKTKNLLAALSLTALVSQASAQSAPTFDVSAFESTLTSGITIATGLAISIAGLSAAVMAWKKIGKYFSSTR